MRDFIENVCECKNLTEEQLKDICMLYARHFEIVDNKVIMKEAPKIYMRISKEQKMLLDKILKIKKVCLYEYVREILIKGRTNAGKTLFDWRLFRGACGNEVNSERICFRFRGKDARLFEIIANEAVSMNLKIGTFIKLLISKNLADYQYEYSEIDEVNSSNV